MIGHCQFTEVNNMNKMPNELELGPPSTEQQWSTRKGSGRDSQSIQLDTSDLDYASLMTLCLKGKSTIYYPFPICAHNLRPRHNFVWTHWPSMMTAWAGGVRFRVKMKSAGEATLQALEERVQGFIALPFRYISITLQHETSSQNMESFPITKRNADFALFMTSCSAIKLWLIAPPCRFHWRWLTC